MVAVHIFRRNFDMRRTDRSFELFPEALDMLRMVRFARAIVVVGPFLPAMLYGATFKAVSFQ